MSRTERNTKCVVWREKEDQEAKCQSQGTCFEAVIVEIGTIKKSPFCSPLKQWKGALLARSHLAKLPACEERNPKKAIDLR